MRHRITEILKNSLNMRIQEIKRKYKNNRRLNNIRRRKQTSFGDLKSIISDDQDDMRQISNLSPMLENAEFKNINSLRELKNLQTSKIDSKYDIKVTEQSSSYNSSPSSSSSLSKTELDLENDDLISQITSKKRKTSVPRKSKFLKKQNTMVRGQRKIFRGASFSNRLTKRNQDFNQFDTDEGNKPESVIGIGKIPESKQVAVARK